MLLFSPAALAGQYFYWADFNQDQTNQPPSTGQGPRTPSSIVFGSPTVVSAFGHLTNQPLLFRATDYEQIQFDLGKRARDYFVELDFETRNLNPSLFAYDFVFDTPTVQDFYLHGRGYIGVPPANSRYLPGWTDNELHHLRIQVAPTTGAWIFKLDNRIDSGPFSADSGDVLSFRLNLSTWRAFTPGETNVQVAIDNVRIGTSARANSPTISYEGPLVIECTNGGSTVLTAHVQDSSTEPLTVVWTIDGLPLETNTFAPGEALTGLAISAEAGLTLGHHQIVISASNGEAEPATCSSTVTVRDTLPPIISSITATPAVLWPPNGRMIPVRISVQAQDTCSETRAKIVQVQSNEPSVPPGHGHSLPDWEIIGDLTLNLRAERQSAGVGRTYTVVVECADAIGNTTLGSVPIPVPHNL